MSQDLLLEIGIEEPPVGFVAAAAAALPRLLRGQLRRHRLEHGEVIALGTPRRLTVLAEAVDECQAELDEEVVGPPARIAFDGAERPTPAAEAFARKNGVALSGLYTVELEQGRYVAVRRVEQGRPASELLPRALAQLCSEVSRFELGRWFEDEMAFGHHVRWLLSLLGDSVVSFSFARRESSNVTYGHGTLAPEPTAIAHPVDYQPALQRMHVVVDPEVRGAHLLQQLHDEAVRLGGELVEDESLVGENSWLIEQPHVVSGHLDEAFLLLPDRVVLAAAKRQGYFGVRSQTGELLPYYLSVANTAPLDERVRRDHDRALGVRLAKAQSLYREDLKQPLAERLLALDHVLFQRRLGSVGAKVRRVMGIVAAIAEELEWSHQERARALAGAQLAKCDLVTLMVGEYPALQGEMGRAYGLAQGVEPSVADVVAEHLAPINVTAPPAASDAGAVVALADRLDTLVGGCAISVMPAAHADPLSLRGAAVGLLRTLFDRGWALSTECLARIAYAELHTIDLDLTEGEAVHRLSGFLHHRLRGVLSAQFPQDAVNASLGAAFDPPYDALLRTQVLSNLAPSVRARVGVVFRRVTQCARGARSASSLGVFEAADELCPQVLPAEQKLLGALGELRRQIADARTCARYEPVSAAIVDFLSPLERYFSEMDLLASAHPIRDSRQHLMKSVLGACSQFASFDLLMGAHSASGSSSRGAVRRSPAQPE